ANQITRRISMAQRSLQRLIAVTIIALLLVSAGATRSVNAQPKQDSGGQIVADSGFRPEANGFGFENYGGEAGATNMTPADMRRMFGDQVCARLAGDTCDLIPPAQQFMDQTNQAMSGGHCEGMA